MNSSNALVAFWYQKKEDVVYYFRLKHMNDSLMAENVRLHMALAATTEKDLLKDTTISRSFIPSDSLHQIQYAQYKYLQARVVNNTVNMASNFLTINRGAKEGIKKDMAIVSGNGIVGRVVNVSAHFATAISILNTKQRLSAKLSDGSTGFVYWDASLGPNTLLMKIVQPEKKIKKGDSILTTSYSTLFPADLLIGKVESIRVVKKDNSRLLYIQPATNFLNLQYVYVIGNSYMTERRILEDSTIQQLQQKSKP